MGIFVVRVHGLAARPLDGVASLGVRPTVEDAGRVLLEAHCLDWPAGLQTEGGYGRLLRVELLHKLRDERRYDSVDELRAGIAADEAAARAWFAAARAA
jgi:riboflavin kinase/FMN adenylyltransferase